MIVREICETKSTWLERACSRCSFHQPCRAIVLGVVRVILLNPTMATVGVPTRLPKVKKMTPAIRISLDSSDFSIPGLLEVVRLMVSVEIVHLEECRNVVYLPGGWPQQMIGLQV